MKKIRLSVYLEAKAYDDLRAYARGRRKPLSVVAEAAIANFVNPNEREASQHRRLARIERQLDRLGRDTHISLEAFMAYIWVWFSANPPLPEQVATASRASATQRYDQFMETLGQRLASGTSVRHFLQEEAADAD